MKICSKCGEEKEESEFYKRENGNLRKECISCIKENRIYYYKNNKEKIIDNKKLYYSENKETILNYHIEYRNNNKEKIKDSSKIYYSENKETIKTKQKEYRLENADYFKEYWKNKYQTDEYFRFTHTLRTRIRIALKLYSKNGKTRSCKKYGIDFKVIYDKIGQKPAGDYHLDHIIPVSVFDFDNPEHVRLAHSANNLRWIPAEENLSKNDYIDTQLIRCSLALTLIAQEIGLI